MFICVTKKSPKRVLEHRDAEEDNGQSKAHLVGQLRGVVVRSLVRHVSHLFQPKRAPISTYGGQGRRVVLLVLSHDTEKRLKEQHQCQGYQYHGGVVVDVG